MVMNSHSQRIGELDVLRGICILGMILMHFIFDLAYFSGIVLPLPNWFQFVGQYGHILFIALSGICVTLGNHSFRRGAVVFTAGLLISYVTLYADVLLETEDLRIWFGILHLLGFCMMVYPLFQKLPNWALLLTGASFLILGVWFSGLTIPTDLFLPLGLTSGKHYAGSDYFPIFPGLGWFLIGISLGRTFYKEKTSLFPGVRWSSPLSRFLSFCGRHSLEIYLLHQPVVTFLTVLIFGFA